jgi:cytochrome P450
VTHDCPSGDEAGQFFRDPIGHLVNVYRRHGTEVSFLAGRDDLVFAFGPEHNKAILQQPDRFHATGFLFPGPKNSAQRRLLNGIFNLNGERHRDQRRVILGTFQKHIVVHYHDTIVASCERFLSAWRFGEVRDVSGEMLTLVSRINGRLLLGLDDDALIGELEAVTEEWMALNTPLLLAGVLRQDLSRAWYDRALDCGQRLELLAAEALAHRRARPLDGTDLLAGLLQAHDADPERITARELVGQTAHLFAASNQSTRSALIWTLLLLTQAPRVSLAVYDELHNVLGGRTPNLDEWERLPLFERVFKESVRIFPPVSYYTRVTAEPLTLGGRSLAKGTTVVFSHYVTHHMPDLFPEPEQFRPDRWLTARPTPYEYLPFGIGPRMCVGTSYAMQMIRIILPALLQRFRLTVVPMTRVDRRISTILTPDQPVPMHLDPPGGGYSASPIVGNVHEMVHWPRDSRPRKERAAPLWRGPSIVTQPVITGG